MNCLIFIKIQNNDAQDKNLAHQENIKKRDGFSQKY